MNAPRDGSQGPGIAALADAEEVFLLPGQWWFGTGPRRVRTLLGSCVAVTLWHPRWRQAGMCHYLLPGRRRPAGAPLDGRYGDEAIELLRQSVLQVGIRPFEFETRLYGGGHMFPGQLADKSEVVDIGGRNVAMARERLAASGFGLLTVECGGHLHRHVCLDTASGVVSVRAGAAT